MTEDEMVGWHHQLMDMNLSKLWETVEDRGVWYTTVHGLQIVGHDLVTKQKQCPYNVEPVQKKMDVGKKCQYYLILVIHFFLQQIQNNKQMPETGLDMRTRDAQDEVPVFVKFTSSQMVSLEKETATHSSILAWRILWTEEPGGLRSMGLHRVGHD